ncbi:class I SAM-dependent methyltransferase [Romeria aff. gracilis LEGE 07310]|uniref:Class I SAM-dependent methyltransferase n=1 Tax=Vasconcelosia minhoensis LEGE 07310 TaxID=915328 RepID=A0A8J7AGL3_9CYAN|nr:methyltransferase domain-containing protein [Romeria gracilis]MBE9077173.1 class I SAM-dependent methyltransferase [Romeria aff. gracilis LEGE 07310]
MEVIIQRQYDRLAKSYDSHWRSYIANTLSFLKAWAAIAPCEAVLDIACGTGEFERLVLTDQPQQIMTGIDISERMLAVARQKCGHYPQVMFQVASVSSIPVTPHSYDVVVCASAFHYFEQPEQALQEMDRMLKRGGRVVILDWCRDFWVCRLCDWFLALTDSAYRKCYTLAELETFLAASDFRIVQSRRVRFGLIWGLMVATAAPEKADDQP